MNELAFRNIHDPYQYDIVTGTWTQGPQTVPNPASQQLASWAKFGLGVGALSLIGRHQFSTGKKGWDYMVGGVRAVEEYSPGRVFRTFQLSHMLSPLETPSLQSRYYSPEIIRQIVDAKTGTGRAWADYMQRLTGIDVTGLEQGFRYEKGKLLTGATGGETLLGYAGVIRSPTGSNPAFQAGYARSLAGGPVSDLRYLGQDIPFKTATGELAQEAHIFTGGQTRLQAGKRWLYGYGTTLAERINQLARAPFEMEPFKSIFNKLPFRLGVVSSSGLKTVGKITAKLGILGTAAYYGYSELDYRARQSELLNNTIFSEGITAGVATTWAKGQLATSTLADYLGLHSYRERQEEIAPGSTSISKLIAFPLIGALGEVAISYAQRVARMRTFRKAGLDLAQASIGSTLRGPFFKELVYDSKIKENLLARAESRTIELVRAQAEKLASGWQGKAGKWLSKFGPKFGPTGIRALIGAGIGAALVAPFIPGVLIPSKRPEELERLYSGEEYVPIRKGRFWEFGRSAYEGTRIDRFQKHWYPRLLARAKEKAIWGEDAPGPLQQWYLENFTYELEKRHYSERPYPITGTAFEDIPFIGPILSTTVGRLFKPPRLMHTEDWMRTGSGGEEEYLNMPPKFGEEELPSGLPEAEVGAPISPYGAKGILGEQAYRMTEMIGLPGFTMTAIKGAITREEDLFAQEMQLESARRMYGIERGYWDLELGGMLGTSELFRRLYPHRRRQIEQYNPIRNRMPEWLPGPAERGPNFLYGDPYSKVPLGEERLPGPGYAALHPELEDISPEDYPTIHKFAILADVAPYTEKYKAMLVQARHEAHQGKLTRPEINRMQEILRQVAQKKKRREFSQYNFREGVPTPFQKLLEEDKEKSILGSWWETLTHNVETPFEYLTPISPAAKLLHARTAVEDYEKTQVWGTENAFWGHPIRDFFRPFAETLKHSMGIEGIPEHITQRRDLEEYFDILKYVKFTRLKRAAQAEQDTDFVKEFEQRRRETLFGIDPYTFNYSQLYRSLPRRERDYFSDFIEADMEERVQIYNMIPENERALYLARWKLQDASDMREAIKKGFLNEEQVAVAEQEIEALYEERETEGLPRDKELWAEYLTTRLKGESYPDWYRRVYLLAEKLEGKALPGPDWVGWHPAVDLNDIKLKIVENEGENAYDYDLWPDQIRRAARRPWIEEAVEELEESMSPEEVKRRIVQVLTVNNISNAYVSVAEIYEGQEDIIDMRLREDREKEIREFVRRRGFS